MKIMGDRFFLIVVYPEGIAAISPGSRSAPGERLEKYFFDPVGIAAR
jgi:hypothetical protein